MNGKRVGADDDWKSPQAIDVTKFLKPGRNVLAVEAENRPAAVAANPAGLIASLRIQSADEKDLSIPSDASWRATKDVKAGSDWTSASFDDKDWLAAKTLGPLGTAPWGAFAAAPSYGPFATGSDETRIIYVPELHAVRVANLKPGTKYRALIFNPVSGTIADLGHIPLDENAGWTAPPPSPPNQSDAPDWVLIIERD